MENMTMMKNVDTSDLMMIIRWGTNLSSRAIRALIRIYVLISKIGVYIYSCLINIYIHVYLGVPFSLVPAVLSHHSHHSVRVIHVVNLWMACWFIQRTFVLGSHELNRWQDKVIKRIYDGTCESMMRCVYLVTRTPWFIKTHRHRYC